jgi:serine/threonine protein phosphatase 1
MRRRTVPRPDPEAPPGSRIYAIGDIHGRRDLLARMHRTILDDAKGSEALRKTVVYVGDYVDRGDDSRGVIDLLLDAPLEGFRAVHLRGNHEDFMLRLLEDPSIAPLWIVNGGDATLYSYGVDWREPFAAGDLEAVSQGLRKALPARHREFLRLLALCHEEGDYLFVHAGIRPGRDLAAQAPDDLMWIRDEFLRSDADHGKVVVHGHSISPEPQLLDNRIGIDTGAFATGRLTCLVLEGTTRRILQT